VRADEDEMRRAQGFDFLFKVVVIGDSGVGKSCLLIRFAEDKFSEEHVSTIGVDFTNRTVDVGGDQVKLQLWDTAGQERFRTVTSTYYRGAQGIVIIFDVTERRSFETIRAWVEDVDKWASQGTVKILVGNKTDLHDRRQVTTEEGEALAQELRMRYYETSARENYNVDEAFLGLAAEVKRRAPQRFPGADDGGGGVTVGGDAAEEQGMCAGCGGGGGSMQKMEVGKGDAVAEESFYDRARKKMGMEDRFAEGDDALKRDAAAPAGGGGAA
jgi:small GTP-binding protein